MISAIQTVGQSQQDIRLSLAKEQAQQGKASLPEAGTVAALEAASPQPAAAHAASTNLMSGNFASAERETSRYIKARQAGQEALTQQASRQMAILNAGLAELNALSGEDSSNYAIRSLMGQKAARRIREEQQQTVNEESEKNLKEIKETIEKQAQEAALPKDANGNPVVTLPAAGTGDAAPMPEISGSNPAPAPEVEAGPAPELVAGESAVPTPEIAVAVSAPSAPSVDIFV